MNDRESRTSFSAFHRGRWLTAYFEAISLGANSEEAVDYAEDQARISLEME